MRGLKEWLWWLSRVYHGQETRRGDARSRARLIDPHRDLQLQSLTPQNHAPALCIAVQTSL